MQDASIDIPHGNGCCCISPNLVTSKWVPTERACSKVCSSDDLAWTVIGHSNNKRDTVTVRYMLKLYVSLRVVLEICTASNLAVYIFCV